MGADAGELTVIEKIPEGTLRYIKGCGDYEELDIQSCISYFAHSRYFDRLLLDF